MRGSYNNCNQILALEQRCIARLDEKKTLIGFKSNVGTVMLFHQPLDRIISDVCTTELLKSTRSR